MMERSQFTFYRSFWESIRLIKKPSERAAAYDAICGYALAGIEPDLEKMASISAVTFLGAKPNLDASIKKAENGKRSRNAEAKQKQNGSKTEAKRKQNGSEKEKEKEKEKEYECTPPLSPSGDMITQAEFSPSLDTAVRDWVRYKDEKRQGYKPTGLSSLITQIRKQALDHGEQAVIDLIRQSMAANWMGIAWEKLSQPVRYAKPEIPKGASGTLGEAELEAIQKALREGI